MSRPCTIQSLRDQEQFRKEMMFLDEMETAPANDGHAAEVESMMTDEKQEKSEA